MRFNDHSRLEGQHAFLSPSNYHWINYNEVKLETRFISAMASKRGTDLHNFAHEAIRLGIKLPEENSTLSLYVNDAIDFKMECEVALFYSPNCFGHADTISFRADTLRVHDLKTGVSPTSHRQLEVYAAVFCLEYGVSPLDIDIELRIYQTDDIRIFTPTAEMIIEIMDKIVAFDQQIEQLKGEELW